MIRPSWLFDLIPEPTIYWWSMVNMHSCSYVQFFLVNCQISSLRWSKLWVCSMPWQQKHTSSPGKTSDQWLIHRSCLLLLPSLGWNSHALSGVGSYIQLNQDFQKTTWSKHTICNIIRWNKSYKWCVWPCVMYGLAKFNSI